MWIMAVQLQNREFLLQFFLHYVGLHHQFSSLNILSKIAILFE